MATETAVAPQSGGWTPARIFMTASAVFHIPVAIAGLAMDQTFPIGATAAAHAGSEHIFGVLETNGWHSLGALLVGLASLYFALRPERARVGALAIGIGHVFVWLALAIWPPSTFWLASNGADQVIHASTAIAGTCAGLATRASGPRAGAEAA